MSCAPTPAPSTCTPPKSTPSCSAQPQNQTLGAGGAPKNAANFPGGGKAWVDSCGKLQVKGGKGNDDISVRQLDNGHFAVSMNGKTQTLNGCNVKALNVRGKKGNDRIHVDESVKVKTRIDGGKGNDAIFNGADDAFIKGGKGNDVIGNWGRGATIKGGKGSDRIANTGDGATIKGGKGNDYVLNTGDHSTIKGGKGDDQLFNTGDHATVQGNKGDDLLVNSGEHAKIRGGKHKDQIINTGHFADINGNKGRDHILNDSDFSKVRGGKGRDTLHSTGTNNDARLGFWDTGTTVDVKLQQECQHLLQRHRRC
jgi:hypothetical protein